MAVNPVVRQMFGSSQGQTRSSDILPAGQRELPGQPLSLESAPQRRVVFIAGTLRVTLEPLAAVEAGARWYVDAPDATHASGTSLELIEGLHTISIDAPPSWKTSSPEQIFIPAGKAIEHTVLLRAVPSVQLGEIPPLVVRSGGQGSLRVESDAGPVSIAVTRSPFGAPKLDPSFDASSGIFLYTPDPEDRDAFRVEFSAGSGDSAVRQHVTVTPEPNWPPEASVFEYRKAVPDPADDTYRSIYESFSDSEEPFNNVRRKTRRVTISGKKLVFEKGSQLYVLFAGKDDLETLTVYAETVVIRSVLYLPQTAVTIYARELRFEDKDPDEQATIVTTPRCIETRAAGATAEDVARDGAPGLKGGSLTLHVQRCALPDGTTARLLLTGGRGQPAGLGLDGLAGWVQRLPENPDNWSYVSGWPGDFVVYDYRDRRAALPGGTGTYTYPDPRGTKSWPTSGNGEDAKAAGKPGAGGAGGNLQSTLDLEAVSVLRGGDAGEPGRRTNGGAPVTAYWVRSELGTAWLFWTTLTYITTDTHAYQRGADAEPPAPDQPVGASGQFTLLASDTGAWLHPLLLRPVLQHAKDTFLNGHVEESRAVLDEYVALLGAYQGSFDQSQASELDQIRSEMQGLIHLMAANLDYFGNPAGWTPMLSFESNLTEFQREIEYAIPILFMTYWLRTTQAKVNDRVRALQDVGTTLRAEIGDSITKYNDAQKLIPQIQVQFKDLNNRIIGLEGELKDREDALRQQAQLTVFTRYALGIMGNVLKVIPVGQPVLGAVGTGLDFMRDFDPNAPLDDVTKGLDLFATFDAAQYVKDAADFKERLSKRKPDKLKPDENDGDGNTDPGPGHSIKNLQEVAAALADRLKPINEAVKATQASKDDVEAELAKLEAADPTFADLLQKIATLNEDKEQFALLLADLTQSVASLANTIVKDLLALDSVGRNLDSTLLRANEASVLPHVLEFERASAERLLRYQYEMAKAFEYRMLTPYDGEFTLNALFQKCRNLLEADPERTHKLGKDDLDALKNIYIEELRRITAMIFTELNQHAPERSLEKAFGLTAKELETLNQSEQVIINPAARGLASLQEENLRIYGWKTDAVKTHFVGQDEGQTANLELHYEHSGVSLIRSRGEHFRFRHYRTSGANPIRWSTNYDAIYGKMTQSQVSAAQDSLLRHLLDLDGQRRADLVLYSRPALDADIVVSKEETIEKEGVHLVLDNLRVNVVYDFSDAPTDTSQLSVRVENGLKPIIFLDPRDNNGRRDGRGDFDRTYTTREPVTLTAETNVGAWVFARWKDKDGTTLSTQPRYAFDLNKSQRVVAVYTRKTAT